MTTKIILFNGPPSSGKDTGADAIEKFTHAKKLKFSDPVKIGAHIAVGLIGIGVNHYESVKDIPNDDFFLKTPRQAYIAHSEIYMKPLYGQDVFARMFVKRVKNEYKKSTALVVSDCGFEEEYAELRRMFGEHNILLIKLYRQDKNFNGDSRGYLDAKEPWIQMNNNYSLHQYQQECVSIAHKFFFPAHEHV